MYPVPQLKFEIPIIFQLTGDYKGLLRAASLAHIYKGAFPVWMGPFDAQLLSVHPSTAKGILSGSGMC